MAARLSLCLALLLPAVTLVAALRLRDSSSHLEARQTVSCIYSVAASIGDTCDSLATAWGDTTANFEALNPGVECPALVIGQQYCVLGSVSVPTTTTPSSSTSKSVKLTSTSISTSTSVKSTTTSTSNSTPTPIQTGMVSTCNAFYLVVSGDQCAVVASNHGISLANFYAWNPAVGSSCTALIAGDYVCVGIVGGTTAVKTTAKSTPTNGITTPAPVQTGMAGNCNEFYLVQTGDRCPTIASTYGIALSSFYAWNPAVGSSCTTLIAGDYVCVGVRGGATGSSQTYSLPPAPTNTGSTAQCNTWYTIQAGDTCDSIENMFGITTAELVAWNTYINSACTNLWAGYSLCISSPITPSSFSWWTPLGCYADSTNSRTLGVNIMNSATTMTIESCQAACLVAGYSLAGVEWSQECFCDNVLHGSLASDGNAQCNMPCSGSSAETCGGNLRVNVYMHSQSNALGCFADSTSARTLTQYMALPNQATTMTIELCQALCLSSGYLYAGNEWGQECFCDNALHGSPAPDGSAGCNMACPGNTKENCGGNLRLSISSMPAYHAVGCYTDSTSARTLGHYVLASQGASMSNEACQNACRSAGYRLAGTEWGQECFCDNDIQNGGRPAPEGSVGCNVACKGNNQEICGGNLRLSLFAL